MMPLNWYRGRGRGTLMHMGGHNLPARRGFTLTDLMIVLAMGAFLVAGVVPVVQGSREEGVRIKCASNLRQIGLAMHMYAAANRQDWPRTRFDPAVSRREQYTGSLSNQPFGASGPAVNDVTAALFLLIRTQDIGTEVFVCPADTQAAAAQQPGPMTLRSNFIGRSELSYSIADPYPSAQALAEGYVWDSTRSAEFAVIADMNPGVPSLLAPLKQPVPGALPGLNSANHKREGQNVLYGDGHVSFESNPFVGVLRDNIYTAGASGMNPPTPGVALTGPPLHATLDNIHKGRFAPSNWLPPGVPRNPAAETQAREGAEPEYHI